MCLADTNIPYIADGQDNGLICHKIDVDYECGQVGLTQMGQFHSEQLPFNMTLEGSNCPLTEQI